MNAFIFIDSQANPSRASTAVNQSVPCQPDGPPAASTPRSFGALLGSLVGSTGDAHAGAAPPTTSSPNSQAAVDCSVTQAASLQPSDILTAGTASPQQKSSTGSPQSGSSSLQGELAGYGQTSVAANYILSIMIMQSNAAMAPSNSSIGLGSASSVSTQGGTQGGANATSATANPVDQDTSDGVAGISALSDFFPTGLTSYPWVADSGTSQVPEGAATPASVVPQPAAASNVTESWFAGFVLPTVSGKTTGQSAAPLTAGSGASSGSGQTAESPAMVQRNPVPASLLSQDVTKILEASLAQMKGGNDIYQGTTPQGYSFAGPTPKQSIQSVGASGAAAGNPGGITQGTQISAQPQIVGTTVITAVGGGATSNNPTSLSPTPSAASNASSASQVLAADTKAAVAVTQSSPLPTSKTGVQTPTISTQSDAGVLNQQSGTSTNSGGDQTKFNENGLQTALPGISADPKPNVSFSQTLSEIPQNHSNVAQDANTALIAQSIMREVKFMTQGGKSVVNLKLEPESLGSVVLQVASDGDKISAQFSVKTPDARAYLESSVPEIRQSLQTNGISVSHLTVSLSGNDAHSSHPQYKWAKQQQKFSVNVPKESDENMRNFGYNTMEMKI